MRPFAPALRSFADPEGPWLTYSQVRATLPPVPAEQMVTLPAALVIPADPLRKVPSGSFTLKGYSYERAGLCHSEFGNCELPHLGERA
jgi:hypothetical protein